MSYDPVELRKKILAMSEDIKHSPEDILKFCQKAMGADHFPYRFVMRSGALLSPSEVERFLNQQTKAAENEVSRHTIRKLDKDFEKALANQGFEGRTVFRRQMKSIHVRLYTRAEALIFLEL